jgi:hypothetical protein
MDDFITDYENASRDYSELGPMWAEMVFPDDFEALKALYGRGTSSGSDDDDDDDDNRGRGRGRRR